MTCPACINGPVGFGFVTRTTGCSVGPMSCSTCNGSQVVPDEHFAWVAIGREMRNAWIAAGRSQREEAARRGITAQELNAMELGKVRPILEGK
jgi:hypothetical protein